MEARGRDERQGPVEVSACGVRRRGRGKLMSSVLGNGSASRDEVVGVDGGFRRRWVCSVAGELLEGVSAHQSAVQWVGGFGGDFAASAHVGGRDYVQLRVVVGVEVESNIVSVWMFIPTGPSPTSWPLL